MEESVARLRLQAIGACAAAFFAASALPAVSYYYVFQLDQMYWGPQAWANWGIVFLACMLGIIAHGTASNALIALHVALGTMLGAALGSYNTAFWFSLDSICRPALGLGVPTRVCAAVEVQSTYFILAFTGLTTVVCLAVPAAYSALVLSRSEAARGVRAAKRQMVCFSVDTQTSLIAAGDKPTVTPAMLGEWVSFLMDLADGGDQECGVIAEKCREALAERGFNLPIKGRTQGDAEGDALAVVSVTAQDNGHQNPTVTIQVTPQGSPGKSPGKQPRRPQVAAAEGVDPRLPSATTVYPASGERLQATVLTRGGH